MRSAETTDASQSASCGPEAGLIVTPHPLATQTGAAVLRRGGTAAEAVVAAGAVLTVVCPHFCGLGGDAVWMLADAEGRRTCIPGLGQAARAAPVTGKNIPSRGGGAALTTAGLVASWRAALDWSAREWGGVEDTARLLEPAETFADEGFPISAQQVFWTKFRKAEISGWRDLASVFLDRGQVPSAGWHLRQAALARVFRTLRRDGLGSFYCGPLAKLIAQGLSDAGSPIDKADLAATQASPVAPLSLTVGDNTFFAPPPPTQGVSTLTILGLLGRMDGLGEASPADRMHLQVEAVKQAFLRRGTIADPEFAAHVPGVPDQSALADILSGIDPMRALDWRDPFYTGDTVYLAASDRKGRHASVLLSTYFDWGAGIMAGDTGIVWNNRGAGFSDDPASPNCIAPGKRPFHTLNPGIAVGDDGTTTVYGTQGADGQPQTLAVILTEAVLRGRTPAEALAASRFLLGQTFSDPSHSLKVERSVGVEVLRDLRQRGHRVASLPPLSPLAGQSGMIRTDAKGHKSGAHDPRGDGSAASG